MSSMAIRHLMSTHVDGRSLERLSLRGVRLRQAALPDAVMIFVRRTGSVHDFSGQYLVIDISANCPPCRAWPSKNLNLLKK